MKEYEIDHNSGFVPSDLDGSKLDGEESWTRSSSIPFSKDDVKRSAHKGLLFGGIWWPRAYVRFSNHGTCQVAHFLIQKNWIQIELKRREDRIKMLERVITNMGGNIGPDSLKRPRHYIPEFKSNYGPPE